MAALLSSFIDLLADTTVPFAVGLLIGAALEAFLPHRWTERWLASGPRSLLLATLAGALLPGCAMSTVPVARSLRTRGAPLGTVAAFLMIAPLISPQTVAFTAALIGGGFAMARVALPLAFTLAFGAIANRWTQRGSAPALAEEAEEKACSCDGGCGCKHEESRSVWSTFGHRLLGNLRTLAPFYVGSLALVALLTAFIPPAQITRFGDGPLAYGAALAAGIPLYVCDGGEVPLTLSLLKLGVGPGPAFTFLLGSVGTCLATIALALGIIGRRLTIAYVLGTLVLALLGGLIMAAWPLLQPTLP